MQNGNAILREDNGLAGDPGNDLVVISSDDFPRRRTQAWKVSRRTLSGGIQEGVELIELDNGQLQVVVVPTRGMSIYEAHCDGLSLSWNSPVKQIVHPRHVDLNDQGGLGWLAGFNEMMVRCGVSFAGHPGEDEGRTLSLHGRIGNIPATDVQVRVDDTPPHRIRLSGKVEEKMFKFGIFELWTEISTVPGSNSIQITDRLLNLSEYDQEYQLIYHTNFGRPILEEGAQFVAAAKSVCPFDAYAAEGLNAYATYLGPTRNYGEQVYCLTLNADESGFTTVLLKNAGEDRGVAMRFAVDTLPYFTLWKNTDTETDGYVTGLEPGTGFPYNRSVERREGRVPKLAGGGEVTFRVEIEALVDAPSVDRTRHVIEQIQGHRSATINPQPPKSD